ncbi:MAG: AmmeMemoRadiSam system protein B [Pseudomonadota bacterium]|nr:AmmeMemoRadiSam system protein B [Pseudomonadota bacterium]
MGGRGRLARTLGALIVACLSVHQAVADERVREAALAGAWYPGDAQQLAEYVDGLFDAVEVSPPEAPVRALIAPHAGYLYSGKTAAEAFARVKGSTYARVIVLAPSHRSGFRGLSIADVEAYETPLGRIPLDATAVNELRKSDLVTADPIAHAREHAIEIELPLLQRALAPGWQLVPVLVGELEAEEYPAVADLLRPLADESTLVVVSSDFTHYGPRFDFTPFPLDEGTPDKIRGLDNQIIERILAADGPGLLDVQAQTGITVCGYRPLALLLHLLPADARIEQIAYAISGELTGDWGSSVSYVGMVVTSPGSLDAIGGAVEPEQGATDPPIDEVDLRLLHGLAVLGVEYAVLGPSEERTSDIRRAVEALPHHLRAQAGAFVTLWREGHLRGCMGYLEPRQALYRAVLENGFSAAYKDMRFRPVEPAELADLQIEVSALSPPRAIESYEELRVEEQGVILRMGIREALYLPEVARREGWTREETLSHLARKAGLPADAWRDGASLEVFSSTKYSAPYPATSVRLEGAAAAAPDRRTSITLE